jgi:hypothetical protein
LACFPASPVSKFAWKEAEWFASRLSYLGLLGDVQSGGLFEVAMTKIGVTKV